MNMNKEREIYQFVEGLEMTMLSSEEQILLAAGGSECSGCYNSGCPADNGSPYINYGCY